MEKKRKSSAAYLMQLAGKYKLHLLVSALFGIASALCSFVPYVMVYRSILVLLDGEGNALRYGLIAAAAIAGKFLCSIVSGTFSHIGAFNTLYNVRTQISRHIAKVNLGFFTDHASGEIKKVIIEDVERIERFLAHQIPDVTSAICAPVIVFIYLLTINVPMALCLLVPVVLGLIIQGVAMAITGKQMPTYHRLLEKLNTAIMQFINGMPVMKAYNMTAESYRDYADTVEEYNAFWKRCTKSQGYTYGLFVALVESGILFALPLGGLLYFRGALPMQDYLYFMVMSMVFLSGLLNLMNFAMMFSQIMSGVGRIQTIMDLPCTTEGIQTLDRAQPYGVSFDDVTFRYDKSDVLKNITLSLPAGSLTAFVGASGAGKTTAAQLIPKFWEVAEGSICIGGKNILELKNDNLMDLVSFVFQETFTLHDSIYENTDEMDAFRDSIACCADDILRKRVEEKYRDPAQPIYPNTRSEAVVRGEVFEWMASRDRTLTCAGAFEKGATNAYNDGKLSAFLKEWTNTYGKDRCMFVLACTMRQRTGDERFYPPARQAAGRFAALQKQMGGHTDVFAVDNHSCVINAAIEQLAKPERSKEKPVAQRKQSEPER